MKKTFTISNKKKYKRNLNCKIFKKYNKLKKIYILKINISNISMKKTFTISNKKNLNINITYQ